MPPRPDLSLLSSTSLPPAPTAPPSAGRNSARRRERGEKRFIPARPRSARCACWAWHCHCRMRDWTTCPCRASTRFLGIAARLRPTTCATQRQIHQRTPFARAAPAAHEWSAAVCHTHNKHAHPAAQRNLVPSCTAHARTLSPCRCVRMCHTPDPSSSPGIAPSPK